MSVVVMDFTGRREYLREVAGSNTIDAQPGLVLGSDDVLLLHLRNLCRGIADAAVTAELRNPRKFHFSETVAAPADDVVAGAVGVVLAVRGALQTAAMRKELPWIICLDGGGLTDRQASDGLGQILGRFLTANESRRVRGIQISRCPTAPEIAALESVIRDLGATNPESLIAARLVLDGLCALEPDGTRWDSLVTLLVEFASEVGQIPEKQDGLSEVLSGVRELTELQVEERGAALARDQTFAAYRDRRRAEWESVGLSWKE